METNAVELTDERANLQKKAPVRPSRATHAAIFDLQNDVSQTRKYIFGSLALVTVMCACVLGVVIAGNELTKETKAESDGTLKSADGSHIVGTGSVDFTAPYTSLTGLDDELFSGIRTCYASRTSGVVDVDGNIREIYYRQKIDVDEVYRFKNPDSSASVTVVNNLRNITLLINENQGEFVGGLEDGAKQLSAAFVPSVPYDKFAPVARSFGELNDMLVIDVSGGVDRKLLISPTQRLMIQFRAWCIPTYGKDKCYAIEQQYYNLSCEFVGYATGMIGGFLCSRLTNWIVQQTQTRHLLAEAEVEDSLSVLAETQIDHIDDIWCTGSVHTNIAM